MTRRDISHPSFLLFSEPRIQTDPSEDTTPVLKLPDPPPIFLQAVHYRPCIHATNNSRRPLPSSVSSEHPPICYKIHNQNSGRYCPDLYRFRPIPYPALFPAFSVLNIPDKFPSLRKNASSSPFSPLQNQNPSRPSVRKRTIFSSFYTPHKTLPSSPGRCRRASRQSRLRSRRRYDGSPDRYSPALDWRGSALWACGR